MSLLKRAKEEINDESVFTYDQILLLHDMLDSLAPILDVEGHGWHKGHWPWEVGHPWRYWLGQKMFKTGHRLMHGPFLRDF